MRKLGTVEPRYVSYNIEMVEVTGGRFWKPYKSTTNAGISGSPGAATNGKEQAGGATDPFENRPPIDLSNPRLRNLAHERSTFETGS
jgi:hypothetical protein